MEKGVRVGYCQETVKELVSRVFLFAVAALNPAADRAMVR